MLAKFINEVFANILPVNSKNICLMVVEEILTESHLSKITENECKSLAKTHVSVFALFGVQYC